MRTTPVNSKLEVSALVSRLDKYYAAYCPELKLASIGVNVEDALRNLEKTIKQHLSLTNPARYSRLDASMVTITKVFIND